MSPFSFASGHVWQGRFKALPIQEDEHLLTVMRYIERNALRANLVRQAEDWRWSSLPQWVEPSKMPFLDIGPVPRSENWLEVVQVPETAGELESLRRSAQRGQPFGDGGWVEETAKELGLEASCRPVGRPRKQSEKEAEHDDVLFNPQ